jgi:hypothetical protein
MTRSADFATPRMLRRRSARRQSLDADGKLFSSMQHETKQVGRTVHPQPDVDFNTVNPSRAGRSSTSQ